MHSKDIYMKLIQNMSLYKKSIKILLVLTCTVSALWAVKPANLPLASSNTIGDFVADEIIVQYKANVIPAVAANHSKQLGDFKKELMGTPKGQGPIHVLKVKTGQTVDQAIAALKSDPNIEYAQPNYIYHAAAVPNDTSFGQLWGLQNTGQTITSQVYSTNNPGTAGKDIDAANAWNVITDCSTAVVAVVDTGINYNQQDLAANMVTGSYSCPLASTGTKGCDFVGAGSNNPMDLHGHGTHVAGTIGAAGNNTQGIAGICQVARILAVRVLDGNGSGTTADVVEGVNFAAGTAAGQGNAKVINMSLGGSTYDAAFNTALTTAQTNGVVVVVAAGNSTQNHNTLASYPCDYAQSNIVCVAAVDQKYALASFSDFDTNSTAANRKVDIGAPGVNIYSAFAGSQTVTYDNLTSWTYSHTSGTTWGHSACNIDGSLYDMLLLPNSCNTVLSGISTTGYASSTNSTVYKNFAISNLADKVAVDFYLTFDLEFGWDLLYSSYSNVTGNPMATGSTLFGPLGYTGEMNGNFSSFTSLLNGCVGSANCTIGFKVTSNTSGNRAGAGIVLFSLTTLDKDILNVYAVEMGTSMASPHVAGIAAMVRARNPNFTYTDAVNAILTGGDLEASMTAGTKTGMVADAYGSLKYIPETTGVTLSSP